MLGTPVFERCIFQKSGGAALDSKAGDRRGRAPNPSGKTSHDLRRKTLLLLLLVLTPSMPRCYSQYVRSLGSEPYWVAERRRLERQRLAVQMPPGLQRAFCAVNTGGVVLERHRLILLRECRALRGSPAEEPEEPGPAEAGRAGRRGWNRAWRIGVHWGSRHCNPRPATLRQPFRTRKLLGSSMRRICVDPDLAQAKLGDASRARWPRWRRACRCQRTERR